LCLNPAGQGGGVEQTPSASAPACLIRVNQLQKMFVISLEIMARFC